MITLISLFAVLAAALLFTLWYERGPDPFVEPEPLVKPVGRRVSLTTTAGYKPSRRTHPRKEIQYR